MAQDSGVWICNSFHQAGHCFFFRHFQVAVYRSNHKIKACKYFICIIKAAIIENITFYAFKNLKRSQFVIQFINIAMLFPDSFF